MQLLAVLALFPCIAGAAGDSTCTFVVGHATISGQGPEWFVVSGRAEVELRGTSLKAKFFDSRLDGDLSHSLEAILSPKPRQVGRYSGKVTAILKTMNTDTGDDALAGSLIVSETGKGIAARQWQSLVVHNSVSFVGIACSGKTAA